MAPSRTRILSASNDCSAALRSFIGARKQKRPLSFRRNGRLAPLVSLAVFVERPQAEPQIGACRRWESAHFGVTRQTATAGPGGLVQLGLLQEIAAIARADR